ncbi:peroxin [Agyrium rufum]|nr:peroxin [Agyrium rufum]
MIDTTRRWLRRNRTKFAVGFGVVGVGYLATQYALKKWHEARERMAIDRIAKENLRRRFEQNQEDCTFTVLALLPTLSENVLEALPVESITEELQQQKAERLGRTAAGSGSELAPSSSSRTPSTTEEDGRSMSSFQTESFVHTSQMAGSTAGEGQGGEGRSGLGRSKKSKAQLWNELKISAITRAFTLIYTVSLLTLLTRIQLNLLGRRNYLSSVISMATPSMQDSSISLENHDRDRVDSPSNDFETNRRFLTFSWWLLHRGWKQMQQEVETAVKGVFSSINPREEIDVERMASLVVEVRKRVEGETPEARRGRKWLPYLLPEQDQEELVLRESGMLFSNPPSAASSSSSPLAEPSNPTDPTSTSPPVSITSSNIIHPSLRRLLDETSDLIDSPTFTHILTLLLDTTFSHLTDQKLRSLAFKQPTTTPTSASISSSSANLPPPSLTDNFPHQREIIDLTAPSSTIPENLTPAPGPTTAKLATILATFTRQAHVIASCVPNEYVQAMEGVRELEAFAAVIYSSNFEMEARALERIAEEEERAKVLEKEKEKERREGGGGGSMGNLDVRWMGEGIASRGREVVEDVAWSAWGYWTAVKESVVGR